VGILRMVRMNSHLPVSPLSVPRGVFIFCAASASISGVDFSATTVLYLPSTIEFGRRGHLLLEHILPAKAANLYTLQTAAQAQRARSKPHLIRRLYRGCGGTTADGLLARHMAQEAKPMLITLFLPKGYHELKRPALVSRVTGVTVRCGGGLSLLRI
jgi:hypothetical protein